MYQPSQLVVQNITGLFLLICLNCISASTVYAQAAQLEGVSVQLGTGYEQGWLRFKDVKLTRSNTRLDMQDVSNSGVPLVLGLGYTKVLGASATLGGLVEYNPISNRVALSVVPGYMLTEQVQGYLKLGWVYATTSVDQGPGARAIPAYLNAAYLGLGAKVLFTEQVFGFAEVNYMKYASLSFSSNLNTLPISGYADTSALNFIVGVGYRF